MRVPFPYINIKENAHISPGGWAGLLRNGKGPETFFATGARSLDPESLIDKHTNFRMASLSKQFTAAAIWYCCRQGILQPADPINFYLSGLPKNIGAVTIKQLLLHTSGIIDYEAVIPPHQKKLLTDKDVLAIIRERGMLYFPPGSHFRYSNTGYCLLAQIIESIHKISFSRFIEKYLFAPLALTRSKVYEEGKAIESRAYGFKKTGRHILPADQNVTSGTQGDGGVYMSIQAYSKWIKNLFANTIVEQYTSGLWDEEKARVKNGVYYNMGWFTGRDKDGTLCVFHSGESTGFRNIVYYNPEKDFLIVLFSNIEGNEKKLSILFESMYQDHPSGIRLPKPLMEWMSDVYAGIG